MNDTQQKVRLPPISNIIGEGHHMESGFAAGPANSSAVAPGYGPTMMPAGAPLWRSNGIVYHTGWYGGGGGAPRDNYTTSSGAAQTYPAMGGGLAPFPMLRPGRSSLSSPGSSASNSASSTPLAGGAFAPMSIVKQHGALTPPGVASAMSGGSSMPPVSHVAGSTRSSPSSLRPVMDNTSASPMPSNVVVTSGHEVPISIAPGVMVRPGANSNDGSAANNGAHGSSKRKTRNNLPKETTYILIKWLNEHISHPYPNSFEKNQLMMSTGLNQQQLSNWFINARRRKIKILKERQQQQQQDKSSESGSQSASHTDASSASASPGPASESGPAGSESPATQLGSQAASRESSVPSDAPSK
ncbi:Piso0_002138 [Millerozyma farinosa CBS 7064]|uniref:Piso0_002138 protein n=1 Tax=Pichia sorbitophila (strain ATCC MYA-4447 / BCRC 22081 / CBS 7064 / NBRC 10061 / NRRL Y-12695) TaxID=559304 RepID=G8YE82_PICSO|nr:Piso0_002138 [Millerozyma farinosa CBS 7064]